MLTPLAAQAPRWVITSVPRAPRCSSHIRGHTSLCGFGKLAQAALLADSIPKRPAAQEEANWTYVLGKKTLLFWKGAYAWKGNNEKPRNAHVKINLVPPAFLISSLVFPVIVCLLFWEVLTHLRHKPLWCPLSAARNSVTPLTSWQEAPSAVMGLMYPVAAVFDSNIRILERQEGNCGVLCSLNEMQDTLQEKPDEKKLSPNPQF